MKKAKKSKSLKGFTLIELLVVIAILAVLTTVSIVGYTGFVENAAITRDKAFVDQLNTLLDAHRFQSDDKLEIAGIVEMLKENDINADTEVKARKYNWDIYYNSNEGKFELLETSKATGTQYIIWAEFFKLNSSNTGSNPGEDNASPEISTPNQNEESNSPDNPSSEEQEVGKAQILLTQETHKNPTAIENNNGTYDLYLPLMFYVDIYDYDPGIDEYTKTQGMHLVDEDVKELIDSDRIVIKINNTTCEFELYNDNHHIHLHDLTAGEHNFIIIYSYIDYYSNEITLELGAIVNIDEDCNTTIKLNAIQ